MGSFCRRAPFFYSRRNYEQHREKKKKRTKEEMQVERDEEPEMAQRIRDARGCVEHEPTTIVLSQKKADCEFLYAHLDKNGRALCIFTKRRIICANNFVLSYLAKQ